jgi:hypothetical protein
VFLKFESVRIIIRESVLIKFPEARLRSQSQLLSCILDEEADQVRLFEQRLEKY